MFIHSEHLNPCKCGSKKKLILDSDDMLPCWAVECLDCKQFEYGNWSFNGAIKAWNNANPIN